MDLYNTCKSLRQRICGQSLSGGHSGMKTKSASLAKAPTRAKYLQMKVNSIIMRIQSLLKEGSN